MDSGPHYEALELTKRLHHHGYPTLARACAFGALQMSKEEATALAQDIESIILSTPFVASPNSVLHS